MKAIAYCHPFVPPEWITAHGLRPIWLPCRAGDEPAVWVRRGMCPVAAAHLDDFNGELPAEAVILTTTCDQIRYAAALLQHQGAIPVFLMHVPRTWQTTTMRAFYREELNRLGRFLVGCGGTAPRGDVLAQVILRYDQARTSLRLRRPEMPAGALAEATAAVRGHLMETTAAKCGQGERVGTGEETSVAFRSAKERDFRGAKGDNATDFCEPSPAAETRQMGNLRRIPLALVGGPMSQGDYELLRAVEHAGGRFALDATEAGERTLPSPVDIDRLQADPLEELVRIYFDGIADVFQRPNDRLFAWLRGQVAERGVRGIIIRRYVWCDHWHGAVPRLREELALPLLDWDGAGNDPRAQAGALGRMEAFLEMLR